LIIYTPSIAMYICPNSILIVKDNEEDWWIILRWIFWS
jgi:hypothetical protein